jgi:DNA topoisomerase II
MAKIKTIEQKYIKLDEIEHCLRRPGRYIGSVSTHTEPAWNLNADASRFKKDVLSWNPGFLKLFDEIISNSVDEAKRQGSKLDTIKVNINETSGEISVWDNGGIPVEMHKEHNQYVPEMIFGELRSGSNFDDTEDSTGTGQNGEGSSLANIFSRVFTVETCDGKKKFSQTFTNNMRERTEAKVTSSRTNFTRITYIPDYERLGVKLDAGNTAKLVKRVYDIAGCNPALKVYINDTQVKIKSFKDYIEMYYPDAVYEDTEHWQIGIGSSDNGFQHVSFVNSTDTRIGGTHVEYIKKQICEGVREFIQKKHKVDVRPSDIANHLLLFINATIVNPRYSSQTKEDLITEPRDYRTTYKLSEKFLKAILKSPIIQSVLDWVEAKQRANELADARKLNKENKTTNPRSIVKLSDATEDRDRSACILFMTEGDSAGKAIQAARDARTMASYPLKGKPLNVFDVKMKDLMDNVEFVELMTIVGLQIGESVRHPKQLRYGKLCFMTDADVDGHHIKGLLVNMLFKFWPELFKFGMVYFFKTPLIKVKAGRKELEFFSESEFDQWKSKNVGVSFTSKYFKGLGTSKTEDFKQYLSNMDKYLVPLTIEDVEDSMAIKLAFDKTLADARKEWLGLTESEA